MHLHTTLNFDKSQFQQAATQNALWVIKSVSSTLKGRIPSLSVK